MTFKIALFVVAAMAALLLTQMTLKYSDCRGDGNGPSYCLTRAIR